MRSAGALKAIAATLAIDPQSNSDLSDLRSNTVQLVISPVRSYKNPWRLAALISFHLEVIDKRRLTAYIKFIVLQERDCYANISQLDCNGAPSYCDLIVTERYHDGT